MWASELADEAPGVPLVRCSTCGLHALRESHCTDAAARQPPEEPAPPKSRMRSLPECSAILAKALVKLGGVAHYVDIAEYLGWTPSYTNNLLILSHRKCSYNIVRVSRGTYAYLPEELRRDQPS